MSTASVPYAALICLLILLPIGRGVADQVRLVNGDRISGALQYANSDTVVIDSDSTGRIELDREQVAVISTDRPVTVAFKNHDQLTGRLSIDTAGEPQFKSPRFGTIDSFDFADIRSVQRPAGTPAPAVSSAVNSTNVDQAAAATPKWIACCSATAPGWSAPSSAWMPAMSSSIPTLAARHRSPAARWSVCAPSSP